MAISLDNGHPYQHLTPDFVLDAIESQGWRTDSRILTLNSYENRVYQVGIDEGEPIIAKFYRPNRWSQAQIEEEHRFCDELANIDLPVVCPLSSPEKTSIDAQANHQHTKALPTVFEYQGFWFSVSPRRRGQTPNIECNETLQRIGRFLGRLHSVGNSKAFQHRPELSIAEFGHHARRFIVDQATSGRLNMPDYVRTNYEQTTQLLLEIIEQKFAQTPYRAIRLHGDCHASNWLQRDETLYLVDFDDARMGPAVQDIWMLLSGDDLQQQEQLQQILAGYQLFYDFDNRQLALIESLRTLRLMHYSAWLARRWQDPAFPKHFPWFDTEHYWADHVQTLREQIGRLQEPPLMASSSYYF